MWAETRDNHVFVYWRGVLIYKRWVTATGGYGVVLEAYGSHEWPGDRADRQRRAASEKGDRS